MSDPVTSDPVTSDPVTSGRPPTKYTVGTVVMMATGFVLLLPGACGLLFLPAAFEGYAIIMVPIILCCLVSAGGIWMMVAARRRAIAAGQQQAHDPNARP